MTSSELGKWPTTVICIPTFQCNQKCRLCGQANTRRDLVAKHPEAPALITEVLENIPSSTGVHFTGGEPLLSPNIIRYFSILSDRNIPFTLSTNGTEIGKLLPGLVRYPPDTIVISLDTLDPDLYAHFTATQRGTLRQVMDCVRILREARSSNLPRIKLNLTVRPENVLQIVSVAAEAKSIGFDEMSVSQLQWRRGEVLDVTSNAPTDGELASSRIETSDLIAQMRALPEWVEKHPDVQNGELERFYKDKTFFLSDRCTWPWHGCYLLPNGEVHSCAHFRMGSVSSKSLSGVWTDRKYNHFRKRVHRSILPACRTCCHLMFERSIIKRFIEKEG